MNNRSTNGHATSVRNGHAPDAPRELTPEEWTQYTTVQWDNIPDALRQIPRWILWQPAIKLQKDGSEKVTKQPLNPNGYAASVTDPKNYLNFETAQRVAISKGYGVGIVLNGSGDLAGGDIDSCRNPLTESIAPYARRIIDRVDSYTEVSPSGTGVRFLAAGCWPDGGNRFENEAFKVELYDDGRFLTITGNVIHPELQPRPHQLTAIHKQVASDHAVLKNLKDKARALWNGDITGYESDESRADLALLGFLAAHTRDRKQIDRLFRASKLYRPKWDERRGDSTWGEQQITKVLESPPAEAKPEPQLRRFQLLTAAELKNRPDPQWMVHDLLVEGTLSALIGPPGSFKSFVALDLALCVATGEPWGDRPVLQGPVVYISAEGSAGLGKRIRAWEIARGIENPADIYFITDAVQFLAPDDIGGFIGSLNGLKPALVVVDTIARCLVGGEENSAKDMGRFVAGADEIRRYTGGSVLLIHHVTKGNGTIRGSTALPGALDTIIEADKGAGIVTIKCSKQKDAAEFQAFTLSQRTVELDADQTSLVFDHVGVVIPSPDRSEAQALAVLPVEGAKHGEWKALSGLSNGTFAAVLKRLVADGKVRKDGGGQGRYFKATVPHGVSWE